MPELRDKARNAQLRLESAKGYALFLREALKELGGDDIWIQKLIEAQYAAHNEWYAIVSTNLATMTDTELVLFTAHLNERTAILEATMLNASSNGFKTLVSRMRETADV